MNRILVVIAGCFGLAGVALAGQVDVLDYRGKGDVLLSIVDGVIPGSELLQVQYVAQRMTCYFQVNKDLPKGEISMSDIKGLKPAEIVPINCK